MICNWFYVLQIYNIKISNANKKDFIYILENQNILLILSKEAEKPQNKIYDSKRWQSIQKLAFLMTLRSMWLDSYTTLFYKGLVLSLKLFSNF